MKGVSTKYLKTDGDVEFEILLFNNPEQAENLKRPRPVTLRNKGGRTMRPGLKIIAIHERSKRLWVVRLSDQAYTVDALAVRGDEG
ncbi:hypothetical protein SB719_18940, partial [Pantoea sp. SIMBA_079]|uniref:hypothetical protein n=1 Tax=Pantoea sp. SIMBA_079 TaxID=3085817 RepID=UPI00399130EA